MSDRGGLGPHRHVTGPKSYRQTQREMEVQYGRPVTLGEVFIKAHTKKDGSYIDRKAERIARTYETKLKEKLDELCGDSTDGSEGISNPPSLSPEEQDELFLQTTEKDSQGNPFGLGSLKDKVLKRKHAGDSSSFVALQDQLKEAQNQITALAAREAEQTKLLEEQRQMLLEMSKISQFMRRNDPAYLDFLATTAEEEQRANRTTV